MTVKSATTRVAGIAMPIGSIEAWVDVLCNDHICPLLAPVLQSLQGIDPRLSWADLSTTERTLLRFAWEAVLRKPCPFPLNP
jgi:hypothetical protein